MDSCQSQLNQLIVTNFLFDLTRLYNFKYYTQKLLKKKIMKLIINNNKKRHKNKLLVATPLSLTNFSGALARASQYLVITHCLSDINSLLSCGRVGFAYHSLLARPGGVRYISSYQAAAATPATALRIWEERYPSGYAAVAELEQGLQEKIMNIVTTGPATNLIQSHFDYLRIIAVSKYPFLILFKFYTCIRNLICRVNILPYLN
jgi:hypothetical protein